MLVHRAIHIALDVDEIEDADHIAATYARGIEAQLNRLGCEGESATVGHPEHDNDGQQVFYLPGDPSFKPDEPQCVYPSDLDTMGRYY